MPSEHARRVGAFVGVAWLLAGQLSGQECGDYPDFALRAPDVQTAPGTEYAEWTRSYQGMPSLERMSNGRLWAAWTSGGINEGPDNYVLLVTSTDAGLSWSEPSLVVDPPGNVAAFVPILWRDPLDRLWLFWNQGYGAWWDGRGGAWAVVGEAAETATPRWGTPHRIADGWPGGKPTVLSSGEWLLPVFVSHTPSQIREENEYYRLGLTPCVEAALSHDLGSTKGANVHRSSDHGRTWEFLGQARRAGQAFEGGNDLVEHLIIEELDRSLWMLIRTAPGIGQSFSSDGGRTWSPVQSSGIRHPLSRFFIRRLTSGRILLVKHDPPDVTYPESCEDCGELNRSHLSAYLSEDDGRSWFGGLLLDERETVSYPDGREAEDGRIFVIYDRNRYTDREVWMAVFTEEDVRTGACKTVACRLRVPVSRPGR
ncbi:MAG TPA: sialidase family protein [Gemmatimonadales bacterium]|nr:sialidase family protein [Gemmatimonadales bacterium]